MSQDGIMAAMENVQRFRLVNALNGEFYAIPEVGRDENWTVPLRAFPEVQDLKGKYLWKLEPVPGDQNQQLQPSRLKSGAYVFSEAPLCAVLDSAGEPCCYGLLQPDKSGWISFVLGNDRIQEKWYEVPCADVDEVPTPRSDLNRMIDIGSSRSQSMSSGSFEENASHHESQKS